MRYSVALRVLLMAIFICLNTSFTLSTAADDGEHLLTVNIMFLRDLRCHPGRSNR